MLLSAKSMKGNQVPVPMANGGLTIFTLKTMIKSSVISVKKADLCQKKA